MTILVIGATGTLGRQVVKEALNQGYQVKCLVRNIKKASFLKEWGAELIYGDLSIPDTIPITLYKTNVIIDTATAKTSDNYRGDIIDCIGKKVLIDAAKKGNIKKFIFCSLKNAELYDNIPLAKLKLDIEEYLKKSELSYTIFKIEGFFQGLINQFAIPILENQSIWITNESRPIAYMDTQDVAKFIIKSLDLYTTENQTFNLSGKKMWSSIEIIKLCEKLSGKKAKINYIPLTFLGILKGITQLCEWTWNISDRLAFIEILSKKNQSAIDIKLCYIDSLYKIFNVTQENINSLEEYLQEYFTSIVKKIKEMNYDRKDNFSQF
uniref:Conserved hypothetical plastid protein n=1 Tax=Boldia erythrosiphon TaxID=74908 RepID=A0A1Y9TLM7_9RHOD|nr:conserved hypothetical plastid protein [Boldia erythrosiphon]ARO90510.1 conserved hypothetical plastid protein [Boldia erythrosiphon]